MSTRIVSTSRPGGSPTTFPIPSSRSPLPGSPTHPAFASVRWAASSPSRVPSEPRVLTAAAAAALEASFGGRLPLPAPGFGAPVTNGLARVFLQWDAPPGVVGPSSYALQYAPVEPFTDTVGSWRSAALAVIGPSGAEEHATSTPHCFACVKDLPVGCSFVFRVLGDAGLPLVLQSRRAAAAAAAAGAPAASSPPMPPPSTSSPIALASPSDRNTTTSSGDALSGTISSPRVLTAAVSAALSSHLPGGLPLPPPGFGSPITGNYARVFLEWAAPSPSLLTSSSSSGGGDVEYTVQWASVDGPGSAPSEWAGATLVSLAPSSSVEGDGGGREEVRSHMTRSRFACVTDLPMVPGRAFVFRVLVVITPDKAAAAAVEEEVRQPQFEAAVEKEAEAVVVAVVAGYTAPRVLTSDAAIARAAALQMERLPLPSPGFGAPSETQRGVVFLEWEDEEEDTAVATATAAPRSPRTYAIQWAQIAAGKESAPRDWRGAQLSTLVVGEGGATTVEKLVNTTTHRFGCIKELPSGCSLVFRVVLMGGHTGGVGDAATALATAHKPLDAGAWAAAHRELRLLIAVAIALAIVALGIGLGVGLQPAGKQ